MQQYELALFPFATWLFLPEIGKAATIRRGGGLGRTRLNRRDEREYMASNPDTTGPIIQPQSPPEIPGPQAPGVEQPAETPVHDVPEIEPVGPDTDVPDPQLPETPPPLD